MAHAATTGGRDGGMAGTGIAHILVARPQTVASAGDAWLRALRDLAEGVSVQIVHDAASCSRLYAALRVDLLVLDAALPTLEARRILAAVRESGPPLVVAQERRDDRASAAWCAQGAAACVSTPGELRLRARELLAQGRAGPAVRAGGGSVEVPHESILQHLHSALLVVDRAQRIVFCNARAREVLALDAECLGVPLAAALGGELPGDHPLRRALESGECSDAELSLLPRPAGVAVPVGISCAPIPDAAGGRLGAAATFRVLGETSRLGGEVLQREKMASIGQLAAGVAHEINNPMGFIHANLFQMAEYASELRAVWEPVERLQKAILAGDLATGQDAAAELARAADDADVPFLLADLGKAIRESQEGSERVRHIVQDLRDFSHPDTGERTLTDLNQCLDSTANIVWPMMKHIVVLERDYAELPPVPCLPMQLKQVFMNLLVNAYQAIQERVGESGEIGTIALSTEVCGQDVVVRIRDDGIGIAEEHRQRIFDPFFTTKAVGVGMGLGLSTSFQIVERHGGALSVESAPGRGTTMRLSLPLHPQSEADP